MRSNHVEAVTQSCEVLLLDDTSIREYTLLVDAVKKKGETLILHRAVVND